MKELIVLAFDSMDGAKNVRDELYEFQKQELLQLDDAAASSEKKTATLK